MKQYCRFCYSNILSRSAQYIIKGYAHEISFVENARGSAIIFVWQILASSISFQPANTFFLGLPRFDSDSTWIFLISAFSCVNAPKDWSRVAMYNIWGVALLFGWLELKVSWDMIWYLLVHFSLTWKMVSIFSIGSRRISIRMRGVYIAHGVAEDLLVKEVPLHPWLWKVLSQLPYTWPDPTMCLRWPRKRILSGFHL